MKKILIPLGITVVFLIVLFTTQGMNKPLPEEERTFFDKTKIQLHGLTKDELIEVLGDPSENSLLKSIWKVKINGKVSRLVLHFSAKTNKPTSISLDGGPGRFYVRENFDE